MNNLNNLFSINIIIEKLISYLGNHYYMLVMISLSQLCQYLVSDTTDNSTPQYHVVKKFIKQHDITTTDFAANDSLDQILICLMQANVIDCDLKKYISGIDQFNKYEINLNNPDTQNLKKEMLEYIEIHMEELPLNTKYAINHITTNKNNHDVMQLLCIIYNINILLVINGTLIKAYYPEEKFYKKKQTIILTNITDDVTCKNSIQLMQYNNSANIIGIIDKLVIELEKYIYPIGFTNKKDFEVTNEEPQEFIKKQKDVKYVSLRNELYAHLLY